jgi:hypothetical protein
MEDKDIDIIVYRLVVVVVVVVNNIPVNFTTSYRHTRTDTKVRLTHQIWTKG